MTETPPAPEQLIARVNPEAAEVFMGFVERLRQEGREEGHALSLIRVLTRRFGELSPAVEARIRAADAAQCGRWLDRIFVAETLDDIFAP